MPLPDDVRRLLEQASLCFLATTMPDGSPQVTQVWVDTDGEHVLVNCVGGSAKLRDIARDPRVALAVADSADPRRYAQIRGRVVTTTTDGAVEQVDRFAQKYLGTPYPWFGGRDQVRVSVVIAAESFSRRDG